ncbi:MAG: MATE family efflux transporter [Burkholderiaceae bacterium]
MSGAALLTSAGSAAGGRARYAAIAQLAWPVFIGQLAIMANGVIDTIMAGRTSPDDIAAIGLGAAVYITIYATTMGVLLALSPIVAQNYGARRHDRIGIDFAQGLWLALLLTIPGCLTLLSTDLWVGLSAPPPAVAERTRLYLFAVAAGLPAALLFRVFYALNNALSRPKVVMTINLVALALKVPLNALFIDGLTLPGGLPAVPALGGPGCGVATAVLAWLSALLAWLWVRLDPWYRPFRLFSRLGIDRKGFTELLRLGLPIGAGYLVEITSFTFMALFVARFGAIVGGSHQIASNLTGVLYMSALAIASATGVLAAQALGAAQPRAARATVWAGMRMMLGVASLSAAALWFAAPTIVGWYTSDAGIQAAAIPLLQLVALFHLFDATQTFFANVLRAYKVAFLPAVVYVLSLWGIGLGVGWWLTFGNKHAWPWQAWPQLALLDGQVGGATGFWVAAGGSVVVASIGLALILAAVWRQDGSSAARLAVRG